MSRSQHRLASHAMCTASSHALKRLAKDERFIGTELPGLPGVLPPWGRQLQYHPHLPSIVPGGGLSEDPTPWRPSRAPFLVPVKALSPISRAMWKEEMLHAGLREHIAPHVWTLPWNVPSQATPHAHSALTSLTPYGFKGALSHRRLVSLTDRTVPFSSRQAGSARPRTTSLDALACMRRFLQPGLPDGLMTVRHFGSLHASCALPPATLRRMSGQAHPVDFQPPPLVPPPPLVAWCPTWGAPMRLVMRLGTSNSAFVDTG